MFRRSFGLIALFAALAAQAATSEPQGDIVQRRWIEGRTAHFRIFSCATTQAVAQVAGRLEQFRDAYAALAGGQAVASPPIVVFAFPDYETMSPFLPVYDGKPANLAAFFRRGSDENLIVLSLSQGRSNAMEVVYHEFAHLLLRHNEAYWPLWLAEGMADIYATFQIDASRRARIGMPLAHHLRVLTNAPLMSLHDLFSVTRESPSYNESSRQGLFYAQSWLLAQYLMLGSTPARQAQFRQLTPLLRQGLSPEAAFTNAFRTTLPAMDAELRRYLAQGNFPSLDLLVQANVNGPRSIFWRALAPAEVSFHLGDELLRIGRLDAAEKYFARTKKLAPASPLGYEGSGLLAAKRGDSAQAISYFQEAMKRGPVSFLAHFTYALEKYRVASKEAGDRVRVDPKTAEEICAELEKSLAMMPDFGPAHNLLGFVELAQNDNLPAAEKHLLRSTQLEPENEAYQLTLAQVQLARNDIAEAKKTLAALQKPYVHAVIKGQAEKLLAEIGKANPPPH
jgi:tetratricopeptide (TPR) repeat protein